MIDCQTYTISKRELNIILKYVWDRGLRGPGDRRKIEQLYCDCQLGVTAIGKRDKISVRTPRLQSVLTLFTILANNWRRL